MLEYETAGDPITGLRWTHKTTVKIAEELTRVGIHVCPNTVGSILKDLGFSLRTNQKSITASSVSKQERDKQFTYIAQLRQYYSAAGHPIVSIDTKKKEIVGVFKNPGRAWSKSPLPVNDHDFRSQAVGIAIPYGIYDIQANQGSVYVGTCVDTPDFATDCLSMWYEEEGRYLYPYSKELLILADSGGSNGCRSRAWKYGLQVKLADQHGLNVTVCHYPPGCSKWNPIEHRLFSEISKNWAGRPLETYETILNYITTTTTTTGLKLRAYLHPKEYNKGIRISDEDMASLMITTHDIQPKQNYTIQPRVKSPNLLDNGTQEWILYTREEQFEVAKSGSYS